MVGDRKPTVADMGALRFTTRVINESMRLYPQPPVLIRRALQDDAFGSYTVEEGSDIFISVWNLHRSPYLWSNPEGEGTGKVRTLTLCCVVGGLWVLMVVNATDPMLQMAPI